MEATHTTKNNASILNFSQRNNNSERKKILFTCIPADGHFNPLMPLAVHLKEQGHDVRWYTSVNYAEKINRLHIKHYPLKRALDISGKTPEELFPERANKKGKISKLVFDLINGFILRAPEYYEDLKEIHTTFAFDIVVADCMFFAIPFIKHNLNIPVISIGVIPLTESSNDTAPAGLGLTPPTNFIQKAKYKILSVVTAMLFRKPTAMLRSILKQHGIKMHVNNIFDYMIRESALLLQVGTPGFEYKRSNLGNNIRFIGASLPHTGFKKSWHHPKLHSYSKIILVTQGTVEKDISKLIIPTLAAFKNSEYLVIVTTGGSHTDELKKQFNYENIIIEDFIPFDEIMPHAHVYVTNGGYGGVSFSIEHKLPMVVAGIHEGKSEINARVEYFKIGINLRTERPDSKEIKTAVEKVLYDGTYRKNAERLSKEFSAYNSKELCVMYIDEVIKQHQQLRFITS